MSAMGNSGSSDALVAEVRKTVADNPCVVYSKTYCPFCTKAKQALAGVGAKPVVIELDKVSNGSAIQSALASITGQRTVPNVFIGGTSIGGGDDTARLASNGQLAAKLREAGGL